MSKVSKLLCRIFYVCLSCFPFATAVILGCVRFINGDMGGRKAAAAVVLLTCCVFAILALHRRPQQVSVKRVTFLYTPLLIFSLAFALRLLWILWAGKDVAPFSDFDWAYQAALGSQDYVMRHATYPAWGFYVRLLKLLIGLFGPAYVNIQLFNAVVNSACSVLIYAIAWAIAERYRVALIAALFYSLMPSNIIYTAILTPEFPSVFLLLVTMLCMAFSFRQDMKPGVRAVLWIIVGMACGFADYLKPVGAIVLIAYFMTQGLWLLSDTDDKLRPRNRKCAAGRLGLSAAVVLTLFFGAHAGISASLTKELGPLNDKVVYHFLFVGLNTKGEGQVHIGKYNHMDEQYLAEHDYDYDKMSEWVAEFLKKDWTENRGDIPALIVKKVVWAWQDDIIPAQYTAAHIVGGSAAVKVTGIYAPSLSQAYYLAMMLAALLGILSIQKGHVGNKGLFLLCMVMFGFALVLLISEAQSRYKCMVTPLICILSALGVTDWSETAKRIWMRRRALRKSGVI